MSIRVREYKFFRSLSVKVNDNWPVRKAEQLWRQMRAHKIAGLWLLSACLHAPGPISLLFDIIFVIRITEIEAAEACKWLRAAGFPQYAQMYEGK